MYGYVLNDPVNKIDPTRKICGLIRSFEYLAYWGYLMNKAANQTNGGNSCSELTDQEEQTINRWNQDPFNLVYDAIDSCTPLDPIAPFLPNIPSA